MQDFNLKRIKRELYYQFFVPIKNSKSNTGLEVQVRGAKITINQLKDDKQTFGLLVRKEISLEETLSYPMTSFSFALNDPSGKLQQSQKAPHFKIT